MFRVPNITIKPKDKSGDVILVVDKKPAILVELGIDEKCVISGLKVSHNGNADEMSVPYPFRASSQFSFDLLLEAKPRKQVVESYSVVWKKQWTRKINRDRTTN